MSTKAKIDPAKTKLMLAAPLFVIPFCVIFFYALGGGKGAAQKEEKEKPKGMNTFLPSPQIKDSRQDKLTLYEKDDKDSAVTRRQQRQSLNLFDMEGATDGNDKRDDLKGEEVEADRDGRVEAPYSFSHSRNSGKLSDGRRKRQAEPADELERKLTALQESLKNDDPPPPTAPGNPTDARDEAVMRQIDAAMAAIKDGNTPTQSDPELGMMSGMLDKIIDIQHPTRVKDRLDKQQQTDSKGMRVAPFSERPLVDPLLTSAHDAIRFPVSTQPEKASGFFELSDPALTNNGVTESIAASVHETQILVSGATVKIRLEQNVYIRNQLVPKGTFIFGKCSMNGERMQITFTAIRYGQLLFPVELVAYGLDGIPGVRIPGSITRDAAKQGTNEAIQAIGMSSLDPSFTAQATAAGLDAAKTLLTRKVKLVKVTIKTDYPLLLKDGTSGNK